MSADPGSEASRDRPTSGSGEGWTDAPYTEAARDALVEKIGEQQRRVAAIPACGLGGRVDRGQHQKLLLGARGILRLFDAVPTALKTGPFAASFSLPVACRFSNGQPCSFSDQTADVRGVAVKFISPQGLETDLLMTNEGGRSHARDAESFMAFADVLIAKIEGGAAGGIGQLLKELRDDQLTVGGVASIGVNLLREVVLHKVRSLATESYWGSVVKLGAAAFKYVLRPHGETSPVTDFAADGPNYLRDDLRSRLATGPIKWQLCVQLYVDEETTPVNDASKVWSSPSAAIGKLEIPSLPSEQDERQIDQMAFNPGNGFDALGITHARTDVYAASARNRADRGLLSGEDARRFLAPRL